MAVSWNGIKTGARAVNTRMQGSYIGRSIRESALEHVGFQHSTVGTGGKATGFLGIREVGSSLEKSLGVKTGSLGRIANKKGVMGAGRWAMQQAGRKGASMAAAGAVGKLGLGLIGPLATLHALTSGYAEGGLIGAAKSGAESVATGAAIKAGVGLLGSATVGIAAAGIALGYGAYRLGEAGREYRRGLRQLEFGGDHMRDAIQSAGAATSRQRAVMALQNTHLNGRMALGNEASVLHGIAAYRGR